MGDSGQVYISNTFWSTVTNAQETRILKLDSTGQEVQRFTTPSPDLGSPTQVAVDRAGNTYVVDGWNG